VVSPREVIEKGTIVIRGGLITQVGKDVEVPVEAEEVDGRGLTVYAGFIDAASTVLLDRDVKPRAVEARTADFARDVLAGMKPDNRRGLSPEFEVSTALKLSKETLDAQRQQGLTTVHVVRVTPIIGGRSCVLALSGAPLREALVPASEFTTLALDVPGTTSRPAGASTSPSTTTTNSYPTTLMGSMAHLRQAFLDAGRHAEQARLYVAGAAVPRPVVDETLEALERLARGERPPLFHAILAGQDDVDRALAFAAEHRLQPTVIIGSGFSKGLNEPGKVGERAIVALNFGARPKLEPNQPAKELTPEVEPPLRVQQYNIEEWHARVDLVRTLRAAGVRTAFSSIGVPEKETLLSQVRTLVAEGLPSRQALASLTVDAAELLGVGQRLGTLERGKLAHLVVMTGPFDDRRSKVRYVIVDGQKFAYNPDERPLSPGADLSGESIAGEWRLNIESEPGSTTSATLRLTDTKGQLGGTFESDQGDGRVTSGKADGRQIEFEVAIGAGARSIQLRFRGERGTAEGTKQGEVTQTVTGTLSSAFGGPTKWTGQRVPEPENPVSLSVAEEPSSGSKGKSPADAEFPTELESDRRRPRTTGGNVLVKDGTVITGTGETLEQASVLVRDGTIAAVGRDLEPDAGMTVIEAAGRFVMPGMIDTHSHIMIDRGVNESSQSIVAECRIKDSVETDDYREYRAVAGGLTTARLLHGSANTIGGQDAVVKLKYGASRAEHILDDAPQGVKFALGENVKARTDRFPNTRMGVEATLKRAFFEALDYRRQWQEHRRREVAGENDDVLPPRKDLRLEALADIAQQEKFIHCHSYRADEILMLLRTADELGIRVWSLQHVLEGYKIAPEIAAHGASCSTFSDWWAYKVEAYDATPYNAALLHEAGVNIVIKSDNEELMRHMNLEAAKSVRYGTMPADDVLKMVTLHAARELGLDDRIGSIEVGKDGDLALFNGHPLSAFARCEVTIIDGEVVFRREDAPTAMTPAQQDRSKVAPEFVLPRPQQREHRVDLTPGTSGVYALVGGTVHPVDRQPIRRGTVILRDGRIDALGRDLPIDPEARRIDLTGLHVYPGLIDAGTKLGISEIGKVQETQDAQETGRLQPDLRAGIAVNVDSELLPVARAGGITSALVTPSGGTIAGQASLLQTAGWTSAEMVRQLEAGLVINWPSDEKQVDELEAFLDEARRYDRARAQEEALKLPASDGDASDGPSDASDDRSADETLSTATGLLQAPSVMIIDPRYEALRPYLRRKKPVLIEAHSRERIAKAILFAEAQQLRVIIAGGTDAWKLADELKRRAVPVIVGPTMREPIESWDPFDATYANPGRLHEAGVLFCIRSDHAANSRNVAFEAAIAVAYGLPETAALEAITLSSARVLGIEDEVGSITPGKIANLVITDGSPLQHTTQIKGTFVAGEPYAPESRQTRFYEKYRQRLESAAASP
jgi:imidazolonepropionase-like amidohydrolase